MAQIDFDLEVMLYGELVPVTGTAALEECCECTYAGDVHPHITDLEIETVNDMQWKDWSRLNCDLRLVRVIEDKAEAEAYKIYEMCDVD